MYVDWLGLVETYERAVETVESCCRRHARTILMMLGLGGTAIGLLFWPAAPSRTEAPPRVAKEQRPKTARPSGAPARATTRAGTRRKPGTSPPRWSSKGYSTASSAPGPAALIFVHVAGAVARPGVVRLRAGARAFEAVVLAGGALPDADLTRVNLARRLADEEMLLVPRQGEPARVPVAPASPPPSSPPPSPPDAVEMARPPRKASVSELRTRPLHLNQADALQLQTIPGVGPALAASIVRFRKTHGPFKRVEEVLKVPRFGERLWSRVRGCLVL